MTRTNGTSPWATVSIQVGQWLHCCGLCSGADVLNQLAAMRKQLQNERKRVEDMLETDKVRRRRNVTTLTVGLKNGHIRKNLTQKW